MPRRLPPRSSSQGRQKSSNPEDFDPDLMNLSEAALRDRISLFEDRYAKISRDRNYMQLERDMVRRFYEIAQDEVKQLDAEISDVDKQIEASQRDHQVQLKVHEQTVQRLEYFHEKEDKRMACMSAEAVLQIECEEHSARAAHMSTDKGNTKRDLREQQSAFEEDVDMIRRGFSKRLDEVRANFERKEKIMQAQYEHQLKEMEADLSLQKKADMHELEERKHKHINELILNHQESLAEAKAEWKYRTKEELNLIKCLRDDVKEEQERHVANKQKAKALAQENINLVTPLEAKLAERAVLEEKLKGRAQVQAAHKNRAALLKRMKEQEELATKEYRTTEEKYRRAEKNRDDLHRNVRMALSDRERKADIRLNRVFEKKLERCTEQYEEKKAKLAEVVGQATLEPIEAMHVAKKIDTVVGRKNKHIRHLMYQKQQATKAYNDTVDVYEAKLPRLGVNANELGFDKIGVATPKMPAGLVVRVQ